MTNIILIGFKNSGKTAIGKLLAKKLNKNFIDTDDIIIQEYKLKNNILLNCREILQKHGEAYFRDLEKKSIAGLDHINNTQNDIIATGGGCVLYPENVDHLKKIGKLIYLAISYQTLKDRIFQQNVLPSYLDPIQPKKSLKIIYDQLKTIFDQIADLKISTENKSASKIAEELITFIL